MNNRNPTDKAAERKENKQMFAKEKANDIAIVGMACRFPGANNYEEFWQNLYHGVSSIEEIPSERWDKEQYYSHFPEDVNKGMCKWGGFIEGIDKFDASFFGIPAKEAECMDPQQRIMLELAWSCFEDAGYAPQEFSGTRTGVYIGGCNFEYEELLAKANTSIERYRSTGTYASLIPNRISHFFNLHGPSMPFNTACSSSLAALHEAVHSLQRGECESALVGGICIICSPTHYVAYSKMGLLSPNGACRPLDEAANGLIRGEGAGLVLLKSLAQAIQDGDRIYGVVRGTALNHGGRVRTLTYPNPAAQSSVITDVHKSANISPDSVGYMELHGTGTPKGDALEIEGLKHAFSALSEFHNVQPQPQSCGIGTVKSNIGHAEGAAGIASLVKVLLCLRNEALPGLPGFKNLNPRIVLEDSPFYVVRETEKWKILQDRQGNNLPRRAGVSSFGFGGLNAHVVIEEYVPPHSALPAVEIASEGAALIVLSAKNAERLHEQAKQLLDALQKPSFADATLADIAYTLQVGREAMKERLAIIVHSTDELNEKLRQYISGADSNGDLYRGSIKRNKDGLDVYPADKEMSAAIERCLAERKYGRLLELWVSGLIFDWKKLYHEAKPHRIALPTYPFAKERYWFADAGDGIDVAKSVAGDAALHPLLHKNTSDLAGLRFSSIFTGEESFLANHFVQGKRIFPEMAHLEMAHAAVMQASGIEQRTSVGMRLKNIEWARAAAIGAAPMTMNIVLRPKDCEEIAYQIYADTYSAADSPMVTSQGIALIGAGMAQPPIDIAALQAQCGPDHLTASQCYETFKQAGREYGPKHRSIDELYTGAGHVLAKMTLPVSIADDGEQFVLHPSVMSAALQAAIGLVIGAGEGKSRAIFPFALRELTVWRACASNMWAAVRYSAGNQAGDKVQTVDIDLCDGQGQVHIRLSGLTLREPGEDMRTAATHDAKKDTLKRAYKGELII